MMTQRMQSVLNLPLHARLGITGAHAENGEAGFSFVVGDETVNPAGALHGGVVYLLCDVCAYLGLLSLLPDDLEAVTHDLHVSVLRASQRGDTVELSSRMLKKGKSVCFIEVSATCGGRDIARAAITKSLIPLK